MAAVVDRKRFSVSAVDCSANFCYSIFAQNIIGFISTIIILFDN